MVQLLSLLSSRVLPWAAFVLIVTAGAAGCRRQETARFTPSAEVEALSDDLEDPDELKLFKELQQRIGDVLLQRCGTPAAPKALGENGSAPENLARGAQIYATYCVQCHGVNGDGRGELAVHLDPAPRDYTHGIFKFISTSNGTPRRGDLINTVRRGVRGTSMPSFASLSDEERGDVVDYVLALTQRGRLQRQLAEYAFADGELPADEDLDGIIDEMLEPWKQASSSVLSPLTPMPEFTPESVAQGEALFMKFACNRCHGADGRGGTRGVDVGVDVWGRKAAAADLTSGMLRGGDRPIDVYRRIHAGISGTPMPGFANQFADDPNATWQLVQFIEHTEERRRQGLPPMEFAPVSPSIAPQAETHADDEAPAEPDANQPTDSVVE